jgi:hypothetical protein
MHKYRSKKLENFKKQLLRKGEFREIQPLKMEIFLPLHNMN